MYKRQLIALFKKKNGRVRPSRPQPNPSRERNQDSKTPLDRSQDPFRFLGMRGLCWGCGSQAHSLPDCPVLTDEQRAAVWKEISRRKALKEAKRDPNAVDFPPKSETVRPVRLAKRMEAKVAEIQPCPDASDDEKLDERVVFGLWDLSLIHI